MRAHAMSNCFRHHQHICALYETEEEQRSAASEFLADGLRRGERGVYCASSAAAHEQLRTSLSAAGIDVERMIACRALIETIHDDIYLVDGCFDTERMLDSVNASAKSALNHGFLGL